MEREKLPCPFPEVFAGDLTGNSSAAAANLSTPVQNVLDLTPLQTVNIVPPTKATKQFLNQKAPQALALNQPITPISVSRLKLYLKGYDPCLTDFLIFGFSNGFSLQCEVRPSELRSQNLSSTKDYPNAVDSKLKKELEAGRLAGPFSSPPLPNFCISPLGIVPKKAKREFRLIHHLSFPYGGSVNDGIPKDLAPVCHY